MQENEAASHWHGWKTPLVWSQFYIFWQLLIKAVAGIWGNFIRNKKTCLQLCADHKHWIHIWSKRGAQGLQSGCGSSVEAETVLFVANYVFRGTISSDKQGNEWAVSLSLEAVSSSEDSSLEREPTHFLQPFTLILELRTSCTTRDRERGRVSRKYCIVIK